MTGAFQYDPLEICPVPGITIEAISATVVDFPGRRTYPN